MTHGNKIQGRQTMKSNLMKTFLLSGIALSFWALGLTGCASSSASSMGKGTDRTLQIDGKTVSVEELAKEQYEEGMRRFQGDDPSGAKNNFTLILEQYSDSQYVGPATLTLAQIYLDEKKPAQAQDLLEQLLVSKPSSEVADQARYQLAMVQLALGDQASAAPTLDQMVEKMTTPEEKKEVARKLAGELETQGEYGESVRYLKRVLSLETDESEKEKLRNKIFEAVERDLTFSQVRLLLETEAEPNTLLDELLQYKLARIHIHLRDYVQAAKRLELYNERYPQGRFATEAQSLANRLKTRVKINPTQVGVILPLSGPYQSYGQRVLTAIRLGFGTTATSADYKNDKTGEGRYEAEIQLPAKKGEKSETRVLELIVRDSKGDAEVASAMVKELVEEHHVIGLIGDILLDTSLPIAQRSEDYQTPVISLSRRDGLPQLGPWTFRISFTAKKQAEYLASIAMDTMGIKRFAILYPRHPYGVELMNRFWDEVDARQGEVTAVESYGHDQTTFTAEAKSLVGRANILARGEYIVCKQKAEALGDKYRAKKARERCVDGLSPIVDFDALLVPDDYRTVSYVVPALVAEDLLLTRNSYAVSAYRKTTSGYARPVQLLGGNMWNNSELATRLGRQIDGALFVDGFNVNDDTPAVKKFVKQFRKVHRSKPGLLEAQSYDAGQLLQSILSGYAAQSPGSRLELQSILSNVKDFPGVTGPVRFDSDGDSATPARIFILEKGEVEQKEASDLPKRGRG
jgi:branched-chain amino acid transport system substrate-binding protein